MTRADEGRGGDAVGEVSELLEWMGDAGERRPLREGEFTRLYEETSGALLRYGIAATGRRDVADDLVQEAFCRLLTAERPPAEAMERRRYLFRIMTNLLRDRWRSGEDGRLVEPVEVSVEDDPVMGLDVRAMLRGLKPRDRELLWLAYVEEMTHREIASVTGLSRLSVRMLLLRARRKAATWLEPGRMR